jgi:hypothetical protein
MVRVPRLTWLVLLAITSGSARAEGDTWHSMVALTAAFDAAGVPTQTDRSQAMLRLIRLIHSLPPDHTGDPARERIKALIDDVDSLLEAVGRLPQGELSLALAGSHATRDPLKMALDAAGLRLDQEDDRYVAALRDDSESAARRERLSIAGIDAAAMMQRLNAGAAVQISIGRAEVPLPLASKTWTGVVFERPIPPGALFSAIIKDRNASLLYYGLCTLNDETRGFLERHPELLAWIYRERAGTLAAYGGSLRVSADRVDVPGGRDARALWEALVGSPVTTPIEFVKELLTADNGRLAYLYESVDLLDPARQRFALGLGVKDAAARLDRFRALYGTFAGIAAEWAHSNLPFARPMYDPATLLQVVRVTPDGRAAPPAASELWRRAFESTDLPDDPAREVRDAAAGEPLDAAAVAGLVALPHARFRRERFEAFAFGQRVFSGAEAAHLGDVLVALRGFARFPALMLTVERLGVTSAALYAAAARHAAAIDRIGDPLRHLPVQAQFQGALAIVDRLRRTGRVAPGDVEPLLTALIAAAPESSQGYRGAIAGWLEKHLIPAIAGDPPRDGAAERALLGAFADAGSAGGRRFDWEGLAYEVSIGASEQRRIEAIRAKQTGNSLDAVLAFARDVAVLDSPSFAVDRARPLADSLGKHAAALSPARPWPGMKDDDVPDVRKTIDRAVKELRRIQAPRQAANANRIAEPLARVADYLLGEVLVALAYAPLLGDPENLVGGDADVAHKHDFGSITSVNAEARRRTPWLRPRQPNGATVVGAVLGLDLALAHHALRRLAADRVPELPRLKQNDREVFTTSVALMNPRSVNDDDLNRIAEGVRSGRRRVSEAAADPARLDELAAAARMSALRRQLLVWAARHDARSIANLFSIAELLEIGDASGNREARQTFGVAEETLTGCYCNRFPVPGPWETYSGRPGTGQLATRVPDLTLRVAELLDELEAPAALLPAVLSLATQDFIDEVPALYPDDWPAAVAYARAVTRERVEDYIASLTATGPLRPASANRQ